MQSHHGPKGTPRFFHEKPIVFLAPGSGLGHLVRVAALCLCLQKKMVPCVIISTSQWARAISRITCLPVIHLPAKRWTRDTGVILHKITPRMIVQDSFPFAFKGENLECPGLDVRFVYLARHLKMNHYLKANKIQWHTDSGRVANVIKIEGLSDIHNELIERSGHPVYSLQGRIRFPAENYNIPIPRPLKTIIDSTRVHLVVHSGPPHETDMLIKIAKANIQTEKSGEIAVVNPFFFESGFKNSFDYFPASAVFEDVYRIYTGCGYNSIAEGQQFPEKHICLPFPRNYDDQNARLNDLQPQKPSSTDQAVDILLSLLP